MLGIAGLQRAPHSLRPLVFFFNSNSWFTVMQGDWRQTSHTSLSFQRLWSSCEQHALFNVQPAFRCRCRALRRTGAIAQGALLTRM